MRPFEYIRARTLGEAVSVLAKHGSEARVLAGGTDLLIELRRASAKTPAVVLDISYLDELNGIASSDETFTLKPLMTHSGLMRSGAIQETAPLLSHAASVIGSAQIRNRGTIGGNIGTASPAADVLPAVLALDGELELQSKRSGTRYIPLSRAIAAPYKPLFQPDEILTGIILPKLNPDALRQPRVEGEE